jgi:pyridoxal phosphate enzyme (YggS family)
MLDIPNNLFRIRNEISEIYESSGHKIPVPRLIAVSKTQSIEKIAQAYAAGQRDFAENYVQEAVEKIHNCKLNDATSDDDICWHFIGRIQGNKCKDIAQNFTWVHTLCDLGHAKKLDRLRTTDVRPLQICIQVGFEQKSGRNGIQFSDVLHFIEQLQEYKNIKIRGLMTVLPLGWTGKKAYQAFKELKNLQLELQQTFNELDTLSMGMSGDYQEALKAGANMLRLGTAIFGARE